MRDEGYEVDDRILDLTAPRVPLEEPTVYHIAQLRKIPFQWSFNGPWRLGHMAEATNGRQWPTSLDQFGPRVLGIAALGSGAALITFILARVSLLAGFALALLLQMATSTAVWLRARPNQRRELVRTASAGLVAGALATGAYDVAKFALSYLDAAVYDPFVANRMFGIALVGTTAPSLVVQLAGGAFHVCSGVMFGVAFAFLFGRRGMIAGIAWGLFLETLQLTLFPGWLHIAALQEFARVSALSHVVYGAVLGLLCGRWLARPD